MEGIVSNEVDWAEIVGNVGSDQYENRINTLKSNKIDTSCIEQTIKQTIESFNYKDDISFVIFGEPQSGKTEMMIALNAKLLDDGCEVIINLLTDSVDLLQQNLSRFRKAGLSPSPKQFSELPTDPKVIKGKQWIIFSKKNAKDLDKLKESLRFIEKLVIIDDEADYASPNSKINRGERTKINQLIHSLLNGRGKYIGVTATPARLDLNNTFDNSTEHWVDFSPHTKYIGQEFFFPSRDEIQYRLHTFDADYGNEKIELRNAIFHFLCGVAEQHQRNDNQENFTMIVHTSGKIIEHHEDYDVVAKTIEVLTNPQHPKFRDFLKSLQSIAKEYTDQAPETVMEFVLRNINRNQIVEINSRKKNLNIDDILSPKSLFSFGVGGNIISRGVTFENLLSMYFTRGVKGKMSQDTYIQRARMFGNRTKYKNYFQLWITNQLFGDWVKCFVFHRLAIQSARTKMGVPVWLSDFKTIPTSPSSIDRTSVDFEDGEMSFGLFDFDKSIEFMGKSNSSYSERLLHLKNILKDSCFPEYVYDYILQDIRDNNDICFHQPSTFGTSKSGYSDEEINTVRRTKGIFSTNEFSRGDKPDARHHLKIFFNPNNKARLFYKINGKSIRFIQNRK